MAHKINQKLNCIQFYRMSQSQQPNNKAQEFVSQPLIDNENRNIDHSVRPSTQNSLTKLRRCSQSPKRQTFPSENDNDSQPIQSKSFDSSVVAENILLPELSQKLYYDITHSGNRKVVTIQQREEPISHNKQENSQNQAQQQEFQIQLKQIVVEDQYLKSPETNKQQKFMQQAHQAQPAQQKNLYQEKQIAINFEDKKKSIEEMIQNVQQPKYLESPKANKQQKFMQQAHQAQPAQQKNLQQEKQIPINFEDKKKSIEEMMQNIQQPKHLKSPETNKQQKIMQQAHQAQPLQQEKQIPINFEDKQKGIQEMMQNAQQPKELVFSQKQQSKEAFHEQMQKDSKQNNQQKQINKLSNSPQKEGNNNRQKQRIIQYQDNMTMNDKVQRALKTVQQFLQSDSTQTEFRDIEKFFDEYIEPRLHPKQRNAIGQALLKQGKFILAFIKYQTRYEKQPFLAKYLFDYFTQQNMIANDKELFETQKIKFLQMHEKLGKIQRLSVIATTGNQVANLGDFTIEKKNQSPSNQEKKMKPIKRDISQILTPQVSSLQNQQDLKGKKTKRGRSKQNKKKSVSKPSRGRKKGTKVNKSAAKSYKNSEQSADSNVNIKKQQQQANIAHRTRNKLGSCYHYECEQIGRQNKQIQLRQVRSSLRIQSRKSKQLKSQSSKKNSIKKHELKSSSKKKGVQSVRKSQRIKSKQKSEKNSKNRKSQDTDEGVGQLDIDWIRNNLNEIKFTHIDFDPYFAPLNERDQQITKLLKNLQEQQKKTQQLIVQAFDEAAQNEEPETFMQQRNNQQLEQSKQKFSNLAKYKLQMNTPLTIKQIIDPNINGHGIYALLRLGNAIAFELQQQYALTNLTNISLAKKKHIKEDLQKAAKLANCADHSQLAFVSMNSIIEEYLKLKKMQEETTNRNRR